jgi:class 3 adenylate cyclase
VAKTYSASEIAAEADAPKARIDWFVSIGWLEPDDHGRFTFGAVFAVKLVSALIDAGISTETLELAAAERWLSFDHVDEYLPYEPGPRSDRSFEEFLTAAGPRASLLPAVYEVLGLPKPDPSAPIHTDEESMFERFLEGWGLARDDDSLLRAARLMAQGTRLTMLGWTELLDEQIGAPARERMLRGQMDRFPDEARIAFATLIQLAPEMFSWLSARYLEHRSVEGIVEGLEAFLASRQLAPAPVPTAPRAIVFVDLSGFTRLTEDRGDETAVHTASSLQRRADAAASRHGGRLIKLLGDGAMLQFREPVAGVAAAVELVEGMGDQGELAAHAGIHAGSVIERDLDVFGRTVNLASRIAEVAEPGQVLVSREVVDATADPAFGFETVDEVSLKGVPEPVALYRVTHADH